MYDLRGGGKAASSSPFDMLKGRKIVPGWDGDLVDLTQTAAIGIVAGVRWYLANGEPSPCKAEKKANMCLTLNQ